MENDKVLKDIEDKEQDPYYDAWENMISSVCYVVSAIAVILVFIFYMGKAEAAERPEQYILNLPMLCISQETFLKGLNNKTQKVLSQRKIAVIDEDTGNDIHYAGFVILSIKQNVIYHWIVNRESACLMYSENGTI